MSGRMRNIGAFILAVGIAAGAGLPASPAHAQSPFCGDSVALQIGETLSTVARKCGVPLGALIDANRQIANIDAVRPGTVIYMPGGARPPRPADPAGPGRPQGGQYVVRPGDTLASIARSLGVSMAVLIAANPDIDARTLRVGQAVRIPVSAGTPPSRPPPAAATQYVVRPGDTLPRIVQVTGVPLAVILRLNPDVDGRFLRIGQVIRLSGTGPIVPQRPQITFSPTSGRVGTQVRITGTDFPRDRQLDILIGGSPNTLEVIDQVRSDRSGRVSAFVDIPRWARRRESIFIGVSAGPRAPTVSQSFRITDRREDARDRVSVTGTLTRGGAECQAMRGDDGKRYSLTGDLEDFEAGDRVRVVGRTVDVSICQSGTTVEIWRISPAE